MISVPDRRKTVELIDEARAGGARQAEACRMVGITARTYQRWTRHGKVPADRRPEAKRKAPPNKLSEGEKQTILDVCHRREYASLPPGQIVPRLADQGVYIGSESSYYRTLREANEQHHRTRSRRPYHHQPPREHCATGPNQVWSWDITYLPTFVRGLYLYLYMIVDVFSRKVVGWEVYAEENSVNAAQLVHRAVLAQGCVLNPPVLHADNGSAQKGVTLKVKMEQLGIGYSYSRPRVSNDNPYSEALFRTCKYRPDYPGHGFDELAAARQWVQRFVCWYNCEHRHSGIEYVTPEQRHQGRDHAILARRKMVYEKAKALHPHRWSGKIRKWAFIEQVWLNPSTAQQQAERKAA